MKIALFDVDGHNFPNFALMKIAAFHRKKGDDVEFLNNLFHYDKVYCSKVFTFTEEPREIINCNNVVRGGTGYNLFQNQLPAEIEDGEPDYTLYPKYKDAYGFITRGCIRNCPWCVVPRKEGAIRPYRDIETILQRRRSAVLMDNNVLASDHGLRQMEEIAKRKIKIDFNQGLDARLVTEDVAKLLAKIKWIRYIRFACDTDSALEPLQAAVEKLNRQGFPSYRIFVYVLIRTAATAIARIEAMKKLGVVPFAQPYICLDAKTDPPEEKKSNIITGKPGNRKVTIDIASENKKFARWVNHRGIFNSVEWVDYR